MLVGIAMHIIHAHKRYLVTDECSNSVRNSSNSAGTEIFIMDVMSQRHYIRFKVNMLHQKLKVIDLYLRKN